MKRYNRLLIVATVMLSLILIILNILFVLLVINGNDKNYIVESNRILSAIQNNEEIHQDKNSQVTFYQYFSADECNGGNITLSGRGEQYLILADIRNGETLGYLRVEYQSVGRTSEMRFLVIADIVTFFTFAVFLMVLFFIRNNMVRPFEQINSMPKQLSGGIFPAHIQTDDKKYLNEFVESLNLLRDRLKEQSQRDYRAEYEKRTAVLKIAHDILNPLNSIDLYSRALSDHLYSSTEKQEELALKIGSEVEEINSYVHTLIRSAKSEIVSLDIKTEPVPLISIAEQIRKTYEESLALRKIKFNISNPECAVVLTDRNRLLEVIDNLIENAVKYGDGTQIDIDFAREENCILLNVSDVGNALSNSELQYMFEPFWRGSNAVGKPGSGLGLTICREIMHSMGGDIYAISEGEKMSFTVVIPVCE